MFDYKNASKKELRDQYTKIAMSTGDDSFFTKKELNYLPEVLQKNEQVIAFASGYYKANTWLVALTDLRIILLDKGMIYGLKQQSIPLEKINSISGTTGLIFGEIHISDGARDHIIKNVLKKAVRPFTNSVEDALASLRSKTRENASTSSASTNDKYSALEKLHNLKEKGIISEDEYQAEKAKILAQ